MRSTRLHAPAPRPAVKLGAALRHALVLLLEAHDFSQDLGRDAWEFAVELPVLVEAGCTRSALRWLIAKRYVEHALERTRPGATARSFHKLTNLTLPAAACFVATASGVALARQLMHDPGQNPANASLPLAAERGASLVPHWDGVGRELRFGNCLVKHFTQPAPIQETILAAFQEEGWPSRIDSPVGPTPTQDGKLRLHEAITRLNRHQQHRLLRFRSENNGKAVRWERKGQRDGEPPA